MSAVGGSGARLVLLGAPGVGKGTQAAEISRRTGLQHISTGDLLRAAIRDGSSLGRRVAASVERGELVPDGLVAEVMEERLARPDAADGFLLDGFPRTVAQADLLDRILAKRGQALDRVISIEVPEAEIVDRLAGRRSRCAAGRCAGRSPPPAFPCRPPGRPGAQASPRRLPTRSSSHPRRPRILAPFRKPS